MPRSKDPAGGGEGKPARPEVPGTSGGHSTSGGHNPPLLCAADGTVRELAPTGPIVGLLDDATCTSRSVSLDPGDVLLLFTDGITELENGEHEEFGTDRLVDVVRAHAEADGETLFAAIRDELEKFSASEEGLDDDATLVLLRRLS